jgi:DNA repair protein RadD
VCCPECGYENSAKLNKDYADYQYDKNGYALDVFGEPIQTEYGPLPVHHTRRCWGMVKQGADYVRCGYFWTSKECGACNAKNDISARYCADCRAELVDPGERLIAEFRSLKRDPTRPQTDKVVSLDSKLSISQRGNQTIRVDVVTPHRSFSVWLMQAPKNARQQKELEVYKHAIRGGRTPETVSYVKDATSGFYRLLAFDEPCDEPPEGYEMRKKK